MSTDLLSVSLDKPDPDREEERSSIERLHRVADRLKKGPRFDFLGVSGAFTKQTGFFPMREEQPIQCEAAGKRVFAVECLAKHLGTDAELYHHLSSDVGILGRAGSAEVVGEWAYKNIGPLLPGVLRRCAVSGRLKLAGGGHVLVRGGPVGKSQKGQSPGAPLVIAGEVNVDGEAGQRATLELAAGLELRFTAGPVHNVGYYGRGGLTVKGTAEAPVTFTAHEKREAGGWGGVAVHGQGEASVEQAVFEFGGKAEDGGALTLRGGALALTATTFRSDARGLWADEGSKLTAFADNKFVATPVAVTVPAGLIGALGEGNAFDRDGKIRSPGGAIKGNTLWRAQTVAIEFAGEVTFDGGELTIEPGSAVRAGPEAQETIGHYETATLVAKGPAAAPVTIGPAGRATWRGVSLAGHSRGNVLENLVLTGASNEAAIRVDGEVDARLSGVTCSKCSGAVIGWSCGAKVSSSQVLAADGTPKIEAAPEGC